MRREPTIVDRLAGLVVGFVLVAVGIYVAVHLIEAVLMPLLAIFGVAVLVSAAVYFVRAHQRDWY